MPKSRNICACIKKITIWKQKIFLLSETFALLPILLKNIRGQKNWSDLFQSEQSDLIKAINTFDSDKGNRLATYAARCIDNEITYDVRSKKKTSREISLYEPIGNDSEGNEINLLDILEAMKRIFMSRFP